MTAASSPASPDWTLECRGVCVRRGGREVLSGIDLRIRAGESLALIGPNGAGKTTLMLAMLGMLPVCRGRIDLDGVPVSRVAPRQRGRWASFVPQGLDGTPGFTVYDVVAAGRYPHVAPLAPLAASDRSAIDRALELCGLTGLAARPVTAVSAGERQKTLIAAAIAQDAQVMFLDEPDTALDPAYQIELVRMLRAWHAAGRGLVVVSHDLRLAAELSGRVVALRGGRVWDDGPAERVLDPGSLRAVYGAEFETATTTGGARVVLARLTGD